MGMAARLIVRGNRKKIQIKGQDREEEGLEKKKMEAALEAILFAMGNAVEVEKLAAAIGQEPEATRELLYGMMEKYQEEDRGICLIELDGAFQLCTKSELYGYLVKAVRQPRKVVLTEAALEALSIIAYKQPVTKLEIEKIRGVKSDHAVNRLVEYDLVRELGRLDAPGKPILFGTTEEFLRHFGMKSLEDLPSPGSVQVENFRAEAEKEAEMQLKV